MKTEIRRASYGKGNWILVAILGLMLGVDVSAADSDLVASTGNVPIPVAGGRRPQLRSAQGQRGRLSLWARRLRRL